MPLVTPETDDATKLAIIKENNRRTADEIIASYRTALRLSGTAKDTGTKAIEEAHRCGSLLNAKKGEVGHGHWLEWVNTYVPEISLATSERWMRLAKTNHVTILDQLKNKTLRQAYIAVGILPDPVTAQRTRQNGQSKPLKGSNGKSNALTLFHQLMSEKPIEMMIQTQDFSTWETNALEIWVRETAPFASMRGRMIEALAEKLKG